MFFRLKLLNISVEPNKFNLHKSDSGKMPFTRFSSKFEFYTIIKINDALRFPSSTFHEPCIIYSNTFTEPKTKFIHRKPNENKEKKTRQF